MVNRPRPGALARLLAVALLLIGMLGLPAAAQDDPVTDPEPEVEAPVDDDADDEDDDDADDEDDDDRGSRPSRGQGRLATGEVRGHLAPAVSDVGQQVTIHAVAQIDDHPGGGNGRPAGVGSGRPEGVGNGRPEGVGNGRPGDDEPVEDEAPVQEAPVDVAQEEAPVEEAPVEEAPVDEAPVEDDVDGSTDDDSGDDAVEDDEDEAWKCVPASDGAVEDGAAVAEAPAAQPCDVTFTVDYGDGSAVEVMRPTKTRGGDGSRRALAHHTYAAEGEYAVTITATPLEGEPTTIELVAQVGSGAARLEGDSRIETAVAISQDAFPVDGSAQAVLLARADAFADALAASTLAFVSDAPVLLTGSGELPAVVADEIARVLADGAPVFLLGGEAAISAEVAHGLVDDGYEVIRLSDDDRIGTALAVAEFLIAGGMAPSSVVVAAAGDFPDALAGAAYAAANGGIILLTDTASLDDRVAALLAGLSDTTQIIVAGGEAAVSADAYAALEALEMPLMRVAGDSRYDTAVQLAELGYAGGDTVVLATGTNYPDALAGATYAAQLGAPVLLVGEELPQPVIDFLTANAATLDTVVTLGGEGAVAEALVQQAMAIVTAEPVDEPVVDAPVDEPIVEEPVEEPVVDAPVDEPVEDEPVVEPTDGEVVGTEG